MMLKLSLNSHMKYGAVIRDEKQSAPTHYILDMQDIDADFIF